MSIFTNFGCKLGNHNFVMVAERVKEEKWHRRDSYTFRITEGSEHTRENRCVIQKCSNCGKEIAWKGYVTGEWDGEMLDPNYARELINSNKDF